MGSELLEPHCGHGARAPRSDQRAALRGPGGAGLQVGLKAVANMAGSSC